MSKIKKTAIAVAVISVLGLVTSSAGAGVTVGTQSYTSENFSEKTVVKEGGNYLMGGLLQTWGEDFSFSESLISKNKVTADSGYVQGGLFKVSRADVTVEKNAGFTSNKIETTGNFVQGGIILVDTAENVTINQASFNENTINATKGRVQGSILNLDEVKTVSIENAFFNGNTVTAKSYAQGGLINFNNGVASITNTEFNGNTVTGGNFLQGGVILSENDYTKKTAFLTIEKSKFNDNILKAESGKVEGGIIQTDNRSGSNTYGKNTLNVVDSAFEHNKVTADSVVGGLIYHAAKDADIGADSLATITKSTFANNTVEAKEALQGGIIHIISGAVMKIDSSSFTNNVATAGKEVEGGAIYNAGTLTLFGTNTFSGNTVNGEGNDIYNAGTLNVDGTTTLGSGLISEGTLDISAGGELVIGGDSSISGTFLSKYEEEKQSVVTLQNGATVSLSSKGGNTVNSGVIENLVIQGDGNVNITTSELGSALGTGTTLLDVTSVTINNEGSGKAINGYGSHEISAKTITIKGEDAIFIPANDGRGKYIRLKNFDTLLISGKDYGIINNAYTANNDSFELKIEGNESSTVTIENTFEGDTKAAIQNVSYSVSSVEDQANENYQPHTYIKAGSIIINSPNYAVINRSGDISLLGTDSVTINGKVKTSEGTNLNISGQTTTFNGTVEALGTVKLDNTVASFNKDATIGTLAGTGTTILFNDKLASLSVAKNETTGLILAATAAANEAVGGNASQLIGYNIAWNDSINTSMVLAEGEVIGEVIAELENKNGKVSVKSQTENRNATNSSMLDVSLTTNLVARTEMNDLRKRMGDLRASEGKYGTWARYDGGQFSGSNSFEHDFSKLQFGADAAVTANTRVGLAFSYTKGDSDYAQGSADTDTYSLAAYGIWLGEKGQYADVIARFANHKTEFNNKNANAKLDNVAVSLSGEFGWRLNLNEKAYVEPAVEVTYTNVDSDSFKGRLGTQYKLDSTDSLMTKAGVAAGLQCPNNKGDVYVRVAAVHEFLNDAKLTATGVNGASRSIKADGKDTWVEYAIGAQYNVNKNTYVYADVERTSGAKIDEDWRANVGLRYAF